MPTFAPVLPPDTGNHAPHSHIHQPVTCSNRTPASSPGCAGAFDAVACCFFIDTAHNVLEYLDVIWATLKVGQLVGSGWHAAGRERRVAAVWAVIGT